ncbi:hypothetical protein BU15DRAFT_65865 [Melanogaster broomeanus]|nr:hypothetical protein BU15DRAFT_65865 [Melanogaster broomeanus]
MHSAVDISGSLDIDEVQLVIEPMAGIMNVYLFWLDDWQGDGDTFVTAEVSCLFLTKDLVSNHIIGARGDGKHWDLFPSLCNITEDLKNEIMDMLLHATCDHLTSNRSSCPLNVEELKNYLTLIDKINGEAERVLTGPQEIRAVNSTESHRNSAIATGEADRVLPERQEIRSVNSTERRGHSAIVIDNNYFLNFHGEECARLNFDQTIHGWKYHPSSLMTVCAPLLFMAPVTSVRSLHRIFVDDIASKEKWNMFVNKLNSQLQDTNLLATVLLNANVGFLAIQSVDDGGGTTLRQLASYMSLVASLASIVLGLVFVGHNRTDTRNTAFQAAKFLDRLQHKRHGLETLAIIYSLPYAFLMWAMVLFFAAFVSEWCGGSRDTKSLTSVGAFMFLVASLVAWCIWTSREQTEYWWFEADPEQVELCDHEETDGVSWTQKLFGLLLQSIPSSWTKHRTSSLDSRSESLAMQEIPRPQDAPEVPDDTPVEDSADSSPETSRPQDVPEVPDDTPVEDSADSSPEISRPQDVPEAPEDTLVEDSADSSSVGITVRQATLASSVIFE